MKLLQKLLAVVVIVLSIQTANAKDYNASLFGIKSDGITLNTRSIQYAIDYINKQGGGRLVFYVGRYLTGSIHMKSNVGIHLEEGAILVGSTNPFDYDKDNFIGLIMARDAENISLTGKGVIDGQGRELGGNYAKNAHLKLVDDPLKYDRANERAKLVYFRNCKNVTVRKVTFKNSSFWVQTYDQVKNLVVDSITVQSNAYWNNDGIDIVDCEDAVISNNYVNSSDDAICLKSHEKVGCRNIKVINNVARSGANGIKFGTYGVGGFKNIQIINNTVYDTYRSAIALESVDGGVLEDVLVDGLKSVNTGNAIFIRLGARSVKQGSVIRNVEIRNMTADVPLEKPDAGYDYEGPVEDMPRNISPIVISGIPGQYIEQVRLTNVSVTYPGGADKRFANVPLEKINQIPEKPESYPEFSMFGELPAWALFARHVKGLSLTNVTFTAKKPDFRVPVVLHDVQGAEFRALKTGVSKKAGPVYAVESSGISVK